MKSNFDNELYNLNNVTPLIVCGPARSGTRMMTDLLNLHPQIAIQDEMYSKVIEEYFKFLDNIDELFNEYANRKGRRLDQSWHNSKHILTHTFLSLFTKSKSSNDIAEKERLNDKLIHAKKMLTHVFLGCANKNHELAENKELLFHGIKTPGYERYMPQFEDLFQQTPPYYIYCLREVDKVWRSWKSLGYLNDIELFHTRYLRSLRQANKIRKKVGDRFILFELDKYISSPEKNVFLYDNIFSKLGFQSLDSIEEISNRNSIRKAGARYIEDSDTMKEMKFLLDSKDINKYKEALRTSD